MNRQGMESGIRKYITMCLLITGLMLSVNVWAADVVVTVKEKGTGDYVSNATVLLIYLDQEKTKADSEPVYAETDLKGRAEFKEVTVPDEIKILATGYDPMQKPYMDNSQKFYLVPMEIESEGLSVTENRIKEKVSKLSLTASELSQAPGSGADPIKALSTLPGVVAAGEDSSATYMRGSDVEDNIAWVNRAPIGYLYHFGGFFSTIHPELVEDINIFPAGFPVEYGNALGGVIDVKLREPKKDRTHYYLDVSTITTSFLVEGPVNDKDSFYVSGRRSYIDLILSPDEFNDLDDSELDDPDQITQVPEFYDLNGLYRHELKDGYLDTFFYMAGDAIKMDLIGSAISDPDLAGELKNEVAYKTVGINWQQNINQRWSQNLMMSLYQLETHSKVGADSSGDPFFADVEENVLYVKPEWFYQLSKQEEINFGLSASRTRAPVDLYGPAASNQAPGDDFTSSNKYRLNKTLTASGLDTYIKYRKHWTDRFTSTIGANYSYVEVDGGYEENEVSPRFSVEYKLSDKTLVYGSWGRYIQTPGAAEIIDVFGNPELEVNKSEHRIIGFEHAFNDTYSIKTEIYHKPMDNLVIGISDVDPPDNFANAGTGEAYGLDIFFKRKAQNRKIGWVSLSLMKSERTNELTGETKDFAGDQPYTLTAVWGEPFSGEWRRWSWSVKAQFHSGTPYTEVTGRHLEDPLDPNSRWIAEYGEENGARTPAYRKIDVRFTRDKLFNEARLSMYIDIQNVTFENNIVEYNYGNEYERIDDPIEITGLPFFPYIGMEYKF